ncbi:enoyl-[acyl-carrier protein] reductase III [Paenibacillus sp. yr247]|uniref:SDR family oxidoreductase n=1 Tax=Paenibacillus sp. yr247 TaxID=1761880 RepID=UPI000884FAD0|nr:SDR family oxidoreductase [Paenibacillus sp. yr247]SDO40286.1 enoyl-[acyl-carrier protein] reductase III [Paenibacillus sp. yr247]
MSQSFKDKKVLITGSSRGIGRSTALAFAKEGADVAIHYRRDADAAHETAEAVRKLGAKVLVCKAELESPAEVDAMFNTIQQEWGALDVFMANAAATAFKPAMETKDYHIDRTYQVVIKSVLHGVQRAVPLMEGRQGRIITVSSLGSRFTLPNYSNIGSAKAALESLTRYLATELGPKGITSNAISPGVVETDSVRFYAKDEYETFKTNVTSRTPLGRLTQAEDVAGLALFLASDAASFITGQIIGVDGGLTLIIYGPDGR